MVSNEAPEQLVSVSGHTRSFTSCSNRVPSEIWTEVFSILSSNHDTQDNETLIYDSLHPKHMNWVLSAVCRDWEGVIQSMPHMWAHIRLEKSLNTLERRPNLFSKRLKRVAENAAALPLELYMDFCFVKRKEPPGQQHRSRLYGPLVNVLAPLHKRWKLLSIRDFDSRFLSGSFDRILKEWPAVEFDALAVLRQQYHRRNEGEDPHEDSILLEQRLLSAKFPQLRTLLIGDNACEFRTPAFFPCANLEDVEMTGNRNIAVLLPLLTQAKRIALLPILQRQDGETFNTSSLLNFRRIAEAHSIRPHVPVILPHLRELTLNYWIREHIPFQFSAPDLTVLKIETLLDEEALESLLSFLSRSGCRLRGLRIRHIEFIPETNLLLQLLGFLSETEWLHIGFAQDVYHPDPNNTVYEEDFEAAANNLADLLYSTLPDEQGQMHLWCPMLESLVLHIGSCDYFDEDWETVFDFDLFLEMVRQRLYPEDLQSAGVATGNLQASGTADESCSQPLVRKLKRVQVLSRFPPWLCDRATRELSTLSDEVDVSFLFTIDDGWPKPLEQQRWDSPWNFQ